MKNTSSINDRIEADDKRIKALDERIDSLEKRVDAKMDFREITFDIKLQNLKSELDKRIREIVPEESEAQKLSNKVKEIFEQNSF